MRNLVDQIVRNRAAQGGGPVSPAMVPETTRYDNDRVQDLLTNLNTDFVGLKNLKEFLQKTALRARRAEECGTLVEGFLHCRFVGPPGTGKTSVARRVGQIFHAMGLLSHGRVREVNPVSHFGSQYVSQFAEQVAEQFRLAKGGVLFIDEAYQLAEQDQGVQIIHQIVQTLTQPTFADTLVIMAGYRDPINRLLERNPGLASRIPNEIVFEQFSVDELAALFHRELEKRDHLVRSDERETFDGGLRPRISRERGDPHFANARSLQTLVDEVLDHQRARIEATGDPQRMRVRLEDLGVSQATSEDIQRLMQELDDRFVGMTTVKDQMRDIAIDVQMQAELGGQSPKAPRMLFLGNPGTGKTSAARELARLLKAVGAVVSDRWVETRGTELKGSFLGQTKDKVIEVIADARGGVLFIDEVYSLGNDCGGMDSYALEAIDAIVGQTELPENVQTAIILAGYLKPMRAFLGTNPGLARRFPATISFPDYSDEECLEILQRWFVRTQSGLTLPIEKPGVRDTLLSAIGQRRLRPHFGNAGDIEELGQRIVSARNSRLHQLPQTMWRDQSRPTIEDINRGVEQWLTGLM
ncbi:AAA family ATPase [Schlesneria sp. DSM 10557]|uniref:AAA family ATPase n=1 Tax=Schlesneria sp. DSM 10557 TaxID=3044399 RepID=UPI0035A1BFBD